ncbi:hypothetical protein E4T56_gene20198 [Termitomyces sp. T112]|nr:hypothetical protein E4T56_gene20198 [Termitomyces sp. T112]
MPSPRSEQCLSPLHPPTFATTPGPLQSTNEELPQPCHDSQGVPHQCFPTTDFPATLQQSTNLTPPPPPSSKRTPATCVGTKAGPPEDPAPPASRTNKRPKPRPPQTHVEDPEVHPLEPAQHTSPPQTENNPYTLGPRPRESNPAMPPTNAMELRRKTPNTPAKPWNSSYGALPRPDNPGASCHRWH